MEVEECSTTDMTVRTEHAVMFDFEPGDDEAKAVKPSCVHGEEPVMSRESSATSGQSAATMSVLPEANLSIDMSRRAIPVLEAEADVCSICLDAFGLEDPGVKTRCGLCQKAGSKLKRTCRCCQAFSCIPSPWCSACCTLRHEYHLQCIMQWAQRSRECPMCFQEMHLQDEALDELLPFGEYVPPERAGPSHVLLEMDQYELDRLLASLSLHSAGALRRSRGQRHLLRAVGRMQATASSTVAASGPDSLDAHMTDSALARGRRSSSEAMSTAAHAPVSAAVGLHAGDSLLSSFFGSWPPAGNHDRDYEVNSPSSPGARGSAGSDIKSRFAALSSRAKEMLHRVRER